MKLRLTTRAYNDLEALAAYIEQESPTAARRVIERIEATLRLLQTAPLMGRRGARPGTHEFPVRGLPFLIVYRIAVDTIEVLTIFHTSQDPAKK